MSADAVRVRSVVEEYVHLLVTPCPSCGRGPLAARRVELTAIDTTPIDRMSTACAECGHEVEFIFDLSELVHDEPDDATGGFTITDRPSMAVDLYGWVSVANLLTGARDSERDPQRSSDYAVNALRCLGEGLKFFRNNVDMPSDSAFWSPEGVSDFEASPETYSRENLLAMQNALLNDPAFEGAVAAPAPAPTPMPSAPRRPRPMPLPNAGATTAGAVGPDGKKKGKFGLF